MTCNLNYWQSNGKHSSVRDFSSILFVRLFGYKSVLGNVKTITD